MIGSNDENAARSVLCGRRPLIRDPPAPACQKMERLLRMGAAGDLSGESGGLPLKNGKNWLAVGG